MWLSSYSSFDFMFEDCGNYGCYRLILLWLVEVGDMVVILLCILSEP